MTNYTNSQLLNMQVPVSESCTVYSPTIHVSYIHAKHFLCLRRNHCILQVWMVD